MKRKILILIPSLLLLFQTSTAFAWWALAVPFVGAGIGAYIALSGAAHIGVIGTLLSQDLKAGGKSTTNSSGSIGREANVTWVDIVDGNAAILQDANTARVSKDALASKVEADAASQARFPNLHSALTKPGTYGNITPSSPAGTKFTYNGVSYTSYGNVRYYQSACPTAGGPLGDDTKGVFGSTYYFTSGAGAPGGCPGGANASDWYAVDVTPTSNPPPWPTTTAEFNTKLNTGASGQSLGTAANGEKNVFTDKYGAEIDDFIHSYPNLVTFDNPMPPLKTADEIQKAYDTSVARDAASAANSAASSAASAASSASSKASASSQAAASAQAAAKANPNNPYMQQEATKATAQAAVDAAAATKAAAEATKAAEAANQAVTDYINKGGQDVAVASTADANSAVATAATNAAIAAGRQAAASASAQAAASSAQAASNLRATANSLATQAAASPGDAVLQQKASDAAAAADKAESQAAADAAQATKDAEAAAAADQKAAAGVSAGMKSNNAYDTNFTGLPTSKDITSLIQSFVNSSPLAAMVRSFTVNTSGSVNSVSCGSVYGHEFVFDFARYGDTFNRLGGVLLIISHGFAVLIVVRGWK